VFLYIWEYTSPSTSSSGSEREVERGGGEVEQTIGGRARGVGARADGRHLVRW
jgi:hypothetical protein